MTIVPNDGPKPYYSPNGKRVPSVTTILDIVNKPYLVKWANNMGLQGINIADNKDHITGIGTLLHARIEGVLNNEEVDDSMFSETQKEIADKCFTKFALWHSEHRIETIATELSMASYQYGGTMDAILIVDGKPTILDWKTSKQIDPEYFAQLAAYNQLVKQNILGEDIGDIPTIEQVAVLDVPKEGNDWEYSVVNVKSETFANAINYFEFARKLYEAKKKLKL